MNPSRSFSPLLVLPLLILLLAACTSAPPPPTTPTLEPTRPTKTPLILPATWTPGPPTETPLPPTPRPTWTNTPEPTLVPTFPPTPTTFPPVHLASAEDRPFPTFALLFLETGVVREWKQDGTVVDLVTLPGTADRLDRVQMFDVSSGGALVALLRRNAIGENEIVLYDRAARAIRWTQTIPSANVTAMEISPDNFWVAFVGSGTPTEPGLVGTILIEAPDPLTILAECQTSCVGLRWRFSNGRLVWSDDAGIWQADPLQGAGQTPERLLEPPLQILNANGPNVTGVYTILSFSPTGRYMLLSKGLYPDTIPSVFDTETGRVVDVPGSFLYTDPGTSVAWMYEDKLVIGRAGLALNGRPALEVYVMAPETDSFLVLENTAFLGNSASQTPFVLARLPDGLVRFAFLDFGSMQYSQGNGIYEADPRNDYFSQLNQLPFLRAKQVLWIPDGSGVLLLTAFKTYYVPANGSTIYEMDAFLGVSACCYAWAP